MQIVRIIAVTMIRVVGCAVTLATYSQRHFWRCANFCGFFAWNMLEYVMLGASVFSCYPLCKGVRCARLCTLFFKSLFLDLFKVYHTFMWLSTKTFELTTMWVCRALTLCCIVLCFVEFILSHVCVFVKDFFENFSNCFSCVAMSYWHYLYYHMIVWLSITYFKKYDKIITQTYVRVRSAQIVQIWFYRTFVLLLIPRKNIEKPWVMVWWGWQKLKI